MSRIATLTNEEIAQLNIASLPIPEIVEADNKVGQETSHVMAQVPEEVDAGVYAVARVAVLGILAQDEVLKRVWTDIVGPFEAEEGQIPIEAPHAPTEEELADLGAPEAVAEVPTETVAEIPAETPVAETTETPDAPLDIQEGEINV